MAMIRLRRELGFSSDVTVTGEYAIQFQDYSYGENLGSILMFPETLALRKELGSVSDVTGSARRWIRFMGDYGIQFQDYSEAMVISKVMVEFPATVRC
ncbi:Lysine-Specific Demethylase 4B [Manis pentadactyla]|nr:Lysine-Specific Demethylase 4B [Manis pentadactyla]